MAWNLLCGRSWPGTCRDLPAFAFASWNQVQSVLIHGLDWNMWRKPVFVLNLCGYLKITLILNACSVFVCVYKSQRTAFGNWFFASTMLDSLPVSVFLQWCLCQLWCPSVLPNTGKTLVSTFQASQGLDDREYFLESTGLFLKMQIVNFFLH